MCGIVGVVGLEGVAAPDPVVPALIALAPRGPDGGEHRLLAAEQHLMAAGRRRPGDRQGGKEVSTAASEGEQESHDPSMRLLAR